MFSEFQLKKAGVPFHGPTPATRPLAPPLVRPSATAAPRRPQHWKDGHREIGGQRIYFRSGWEYKYATYLQFLVDQKQIASWEYEAQTFWFQGIKRGCVSYLPDFRVTDLKGNVEYHEVKGWFDQRSKTKLKRMAKYHPMIALRVIDSAWFKTNSPKLSFLPGWGKK